MPIVTQTPAQVFKKRARADARLDMPIEKLEGRPARYQVGPIELLIQALPAGKTGEYVARLLLVWPDALFHAAIGDQKLTREIDYVRIASDMSARRALEGDEAKPISAEEVMLAVSEVGYTLADPQVRRLMTDMVFEVCKATPGIAWPREEGAEAPAGCVWLDEYLFDRLVGEEMVFLTRALFLGIGGFPGDVAERFTRR